MAHPVPLFATTVLLCLSASALFTRAAQAEELAPLSVIDWLDTQPEIRTALPKPAPAPRVAEPPVSENALAPSVSVQPLGQGQPREIGLVPASVTGLPADLWVGSDVATLIKLIEAVPDLHLPAAQSLLYTLLLAEARAPSNDAVAGDALALARVAKLQERGALDPALALIEQAGVTTSPAHFDRWMQVSLLTGTEDRACDVLRGAPHLTEDYGTRIFCAARAGEWENAALTFGSAQALGLMSAAHLALADRFLHPDAFEGTDPLPVPRVMDPLTFRLFETIGEPIPSATLPRAYAVADLRNLSGWKAQLEAAERLTRAGALPDNRLLGIYTERQAAASGGIWDRVAALKRFETALDTASIDAVSKTLPEIWEGMREAGLEVPFAGLFAEQLAPLALNGTAAAVAMDIALLAPAYESAAAQASPQTLATQIAMGEVPDTRPRDVGQAAIYDAFAGAPPRADLVAMVQQARLGEAILHLLPLLHEGSNGKARSLTDALATLRALGLEDAARRAALQTLLLRG
jgi:hypothetical protein